MKDQEILYFFQILKANYSDNREPPDEHKQKAFHEVWRGERKSGFEKDNITWMSLGYHMEKCFGSQESADRIYNLLAKKFEIDNHDI